MTDVLSGGFRVIYMLSYIGDSDDGSVSRAGLEEITADRWIVIHGGLGRTATTF